MCFYVLSVLCICFYVFPWVFDEDSPNWFYIYTYAHIYTNISHINFVVRNANNFENDILLKRTYVKDCKFKPNINTTDFLFPFYSTAQQSSVWNPSTERARDWGALHLVAIRSYSGSGNLLLLLYKRTDGTHGLNQHPIPESHSYPWGCSC